MTLFDPLAEYEVEKDLSDARRPGLPLPLLSVTEAVVAVLADAAEAMDARALDTITCCTADINNFFV